MTKKPKNYRIRIVQDRCKTYFTRVNGEVRYFTASEIPLSLANLVADRAAELRFDLEDCQDATDAAHCVRRILTGMWKNNPSQCPTVEPL